MNILLKILFSYCIICICLMIFGTVGLLVKPHLIESIKTQSKYKLRYELKSTFQLFLFYYIFCWIWPYLLLVNKKEER